MLYEDILTARNIDRLLAARSVMESYRLKRAKVYEEASPDRFLKDKAMADIINAYMRGLKALGFDRYKDFTEFNDKMCLATVQKVYPLTSVCNHCEGYKDTPPCVVTCDKEAWYYKWTGSEEDYAIIWKIILIAVKHRKITRNKGKSIILTDKVLDRHGEVDNMVKPKNGFVVEIGTVVHSAICPPKMGFENTLVSWPEDEPVDIWWTIDK